MQPIVVDNVTYVPVVDNAIKIAVLDRGFVYIGYITREGDQVTIHNARCIIRWGTTGHLGELTGGPTDKTNLGEKCVVKCREDKVIHLIEVEQEPWAAHLS